MLARSLLLALAVSTAAAADKAWTFEPGQTLVSVELGPLHRRISATSLSLTGKVIEQDDGLMQAEVHLALASFATGKAATEAQFRQASEGQSPEIVFMGASSQPAKDGVVKIEGTLTMHGVTRALTVPVNFVRVRGVRYGHATFVLHLADFGIPAPAGATDEVRVDVDAGLRPDSALASRG